MKNLFQLERKFSNLFYFASTTLFLGSSFILKRKKLYLNETNKESKKLDFSSLPTYTRKQVGEHYTFESGIWVTYKDGVYDVTDFVKVHPGGGEKIMLIAGGALEPFWEMYSFHKKPEIEDTIFQYRVGNLDSKEILDPKDLPNFESLKKDNVQRSKHLLTHLNFPFCAEGSLENLIKNFYTPNEYFFIRNHNLVPPDLVEENYKLEISDKISGNKQKISLQQLKLKYQSKTVETVTVCSGNRRSQMDKPKTPKGISWNVGAIANGKWEGLSLRDILLDMGYNKENSKNLHLIATGQDKDFQGSHYATSIPLEIIFQETNDIILAYSYNGGDIPYEHGFPLRLIIPGFFGVRNVKWLKSIEIADHECPGPFQQKDYKIVPANVEWDQLDMSKIPPLNEISVNSAVVEPADGAIIQQGDEIKIRGWALGTYGSKVKKLEISFDEGKNWRKVTNLLFNQNTHKKVYGWTLWEYPLNTSKIKGQLNVWIRAEDSDGHTQPASAEEIWNVRGLNNNAIHKIKINIL